MAKFIYNTNDTMRIIGKQSIETVDGVANHDFLAVINAYNETDTNRNPLSMGFDLFILGFMYGKRAERASRKREKLQPLTVAPGEQNQ